MTNVIEKYHIGEFLKKIVKRNKIAIFFLRTKLILNIFVKKVTVEEGKN